MQVNSIKSIFAKISGSGNIYYTGSPIIEINVSGSGKVIPSNWFNIYNNSLTMKRLLLILIIILSGNVAFSQEFKQAVGIRIGYTGGIEYRVYSD